MPRREPRLVRYCSPFGSPAWMSREEAERHLRHDDDLYLKLQEVGILSESQRRHGPPRIETSRG